MPGFLTLSTIEQPVIAGKKLLAEVTTTNPDKGDSSYYLHFRISSGPSLFVFNGAVEQKKQPDGNDQARFVFSRIVRDLVGYQLPAFNTGQHYLDTGVLQKVAIRYEERWNDGSSDQVNFYDAFIPVLNARIGHKNLSFSFQDNFIVAPSEQYLRFLTFTGRGQTVYADSHLYLSLYRQYTDAFQLDVIAKLNYTDGTSQEFTTDQVDHTDSGQLGDLEDNNVVVIPCGYNQIGLDQSATKQVASYEIYCTEVPSGNRITEYFKFNLSTARKTKSFLFQNSVGGWGTIVCKGEYEQVYEQDTEFHEVPLPDVPVATDTQYRNLRKAGKEAFTASAGYLTTKERQHFEEFMKSEVVFEVGESDYLPIRFTKISLPLVNTFPQVLPAVFEYEYAFDVDGFNHKIEW